MTQVVPFPQAANNTQAPMLNQGQQMNALQLFEASVPVANAQNNERLKALLGDLGGNAGPDKLSIKAGRFRKIVGGAEVYVHPLPTLDVVILGAVPYVSRIFFEGKYVEGSDVRPSCSSANGVDSDANVENRQSDKCATCAKNQKGSKTNNAGKAGVACGFRKHLAVMIWGDPEAKVYLLDLPAASIFGEGKPQQGQLSFQKYVQLLVQRGIDPLMMVTRLQFDMSTEFPCVLFSPALTPDNTAIQFVPEQYAPNFVALSESQAVKDICNVPAPGTVVQVAKTPALAAPAQTPALAAPAAQPAMPQTQVAPQPAAIPNVQVAQPIPPMPAMPQMPAFPQAPAVVATAPVSQPVMPAVDVSVTNAAVPAPAVSSVPPMPATPSAPTAPIQQPAAVASVAPVVETAPIDSAEVSNWLAGLNAQA